MNRILVAILVSVSLAGCVGEEAPQQQQNAQPAPPVDKSRVVVAVLEFGGTNPYHEDFREPGQTDHPSTYLDAYPADAQPLNLSLGLPYNQAVAADQATWENATANGTLRYVPGTNIVGLISFNGGPGLDPGGHQTGTTSLATGNVHGLAPDADVVVVTGDLFGGIAWIAEQHWIDVVSISLGAFLGACGVVGETCNPVIDPCIGNPFLPVSFVRNLRAIHDRGGQVFAAAGYGCGTRILDTGVSYPGLSITSFFSGPSWVMTVGTYHAQAEQGEYIAAYPVDLLSLASGYQAASHTSHNGSIDFGNASGAIPRAAGIYASILQEARNLVGDRQEARGGGILAKGSPHGAGPLVDGTLTLAEMEAVFLHSGRVVDSLTAYQEHGSDPVAWAQNTMPAPPGAEFLSQGFGMMDEATQAAAIRSLTTGIPSRMQEDAWDLAVDAVRDGIWQTIDDNGLYVI